MATFNSFRANFNYALKNTKFTKQKRLIKKSSIIRTLTSTSKCFSQK